MPLFCPVSGAEILRKPDWVNRKVTDSFTSNFCVIGDRVIHSAPEGRGCHESVHRSLRLNAEVGDYVSKRHGSYVQIEDYAALSGSTSEARRYFVKSLDSRRYLSALIFCNLSPALSIAVNIGRRLKTTGKDVYVVRNYAEAVTLALELVRYKGSRTPVDLKQWYDDDTGELRPVKVDWDESWDVRLPEYSNRPLVINDKIIHSTSTGYLRVEHIPAIEEFRDRCTAGAGSAVEYVIIDLSGVTRSSRSARALYMRSIVRWHQKQPLRMYIGYGGNTAMKTAMRLGRPLMPFKTRIARDVGHAFEMVREDMDKRSEGDTARKEPDKHYVVRRDDMEKLMAFLGRIDWASQGIDDSIRIEADNPLFFLYQSIRLVKEELDELFIERKQFEADLHQSRKMESIGTLAAGIAHEFNNVLAMIVGNTDLALREIGEKHAAHGYLRDIESAAERAENVVKQLLNYSRKDDQHLQPIDAVQVIQDAVGLLRASLPATIDVRFRHPSEPVTISGDATQMNQILMNLVANAVQVMDEEGGVLDIDVVTVRKFEVGAEPGDEPAAEEYLKIVVADNGPGVSPVHLPRIFDPYFTTKDVGEGSGMGLAIVLSIVENHGGTVDVSSELGAGTTFTILLPVIAREPSPLAEGHSGSLRGQERILFVEDEEAIARMMQGTLERLGYRLETFTDPGSALESFRGRANDFDLCIADLAMPEMSGIQLAEQLRLMRPDLPVIICTGGGTSTEEIPVRDLRINAIARKPGDVLRMSRIIRRVMSEVDVSLAS